MKENWKLISVGVGVFGVIFIVFMIWALSYQRETQKHVFERDGHTYDRIYFQTHPHLVPSPDCEMCRYTLDSIINVKVDSILEANELKR